MRLREGPLLAVIGVDGAEVFASVAAGELVREVEFALPLRELAAAGAEVYFASVEEVNGKYRATASRSVALLARAGTPHEAKRILDDILEAHCPPSLYYRRDIPRLPGD